MFCHPATIGLGVWPYGLLGVRRIQQSIQLGERRPEMTAATVAGSGWSSVALGTGVVVRGRSSGGVLGAPANVLSTVTLSDAAEVGSSHGGDEAQRRRASVVVANGARGGNQQTGERGWEQGLTAMPKRRSASPGKSWRRRIDQRWLGCPRLKTRAKTAFDGVWSRVGQRRGPGR